ncbi:MAG: transposase DNA-binding-containing protein [Planctomycetota bacterium]|nr:transposase DNA-binding-containing protein [Planctomycetota bacterium]
MLELDVNKWAQQQFGSCELGDLRRTRRLVQFAAQVAADPDASTPTQTEKWSDLACSVCACQGRLI